MYNVRAIRWTHGWELHIDGIGVTQCHTLADAERMVRDYLECDDIADATTAEIRITPELDGLETEARESAELTAKAALAQRQAAARARQLAHQLRDAGLSVTDTAVVMGVSRGRVSQLTKV